MNLITNREGSKIHRIVSRIIPGLDGNAYMCAIIEPLWAIFYGMIFFYMPLYMQSLGLSEIQMGFINSFGAVLATITSFMAGPITDKLGRKRTTLYFDLISWTGAMIVWAISQNFWFFIFAAVLNSFLRVPSTSWTCLAIEDTPPERRAVFFSIISIIGLASGIFTPITGLLISKLGTETSLRILLLLGCISMTTMFIVRNNGVTETRIGKELMNLHSNLSLRDKYIDYKNAMKFMITNPVTAVTLMIVLLTNFQAAFQFFLVIYLKNQVGLSASLTSIIPGISAVVNLIVYIIFIPRLIRRPESNNLSIGLLFSIIGSGLFLFILKGSYIILFISTILTAVGSLLTGTFRDTLWNNVIGEGERAKIFSACQGLISVISIPSGIMAGFLYKEKPIYPFIASCIIFSLSFVFSLYIIKLKNAQKNSLVK